MFTDKRNFLVIKDKSSMNIFKWDQNRYHINVTGINTISHVNSTLDWVIRNYCSLPEFTYLHHTIDNITATYYLGHRISLENLAAQLADCNYNAERFPGLHVKIGKGAAIIFSSGKVNLLGYNSNANIEASWEVIKHMVTSAVNRKPMLLK